MRISDWSSDVCSSDLVGALQAVEPGLHHLRAVDGDLLDPRLVLLEHHAALQLGGDRKSVVKGKSVSVRVDLGGRRIIKQKYDSHVSHRHNVNSQQDQ